MLVHSDGGSYKPLNWMSAPARLTQVEPSEEDKAQGITEVWQVEPTKTDGLLVIRIFEILAQIEEQLGQDPGLVKDGVEAHLQELLAEQVATILGSGWTLFRREHPTPIGLFRSARFDLLVYDAQDLPVAVEVKRRGGIDGVEQLTRYLELLGREQRYGKIRGIFAAQEITPQARTLAEDRGIECLILDYAAMRGMDNAEERLF